MFKAKVKFFEDPLCVNDLLRTETVAVLLRCLWTIEFSEVSLFTTPETDLESCSFESFNLMDHHCAPDHLPGKEAVGFLLDIE